MVEIGRSFFGLNLGGGFNPSQNMSQIGSFPQVGVKMKNILKPPPSQFISDL